MSVLLTGNFLKNARSMTFADANGINWSLDPATNKITASYSGAGSNGAANPSAKVGMSTVNGTAATFMRSDAAPPIDPAIDPTWTGTHTFNTPPVINGISWTAPTLLNSWAPYGSGYTPPGYYKDPTGRVYVRGLVRNGSSGGAIIFQLPGGYTPAYVCIFAGISNEAICDIRIDTSGNVYASSGGSTTWICLDGISFMTS